MTPEQIALIPKPVDRSHLNTSAVLPYGLTASHIASAMDDFIDFLGFLNQQLAARQLPRLEMFLMPANFSSIVGEFMNMRIPQYCPTVVKNQYHNGHPDLVPKGMFPGDATQHSTDGIEVKGSRHASGWQGHNAEDVWLMVFHFDSNTANDERNNVGPKPFEFKGVYAAELQKSDWSFSGRNGASRRTITASVTKIGCMKMKANSVYQTRSSVCLNVTPSDDSLGTASFDMS